VNIIKGILLKRPQTKFLTTPLIKGKLISSGIPGSAFIDMEDLKYAEIPFLGHRFESIIFFNNGIMVTGNLFGSYVTKDADFLDRIFLSHVRTFHLANISSNERLKLALEKIKLFVKGAAFVLPYYGYGIGPYMKDAVYEVLTKLEIPSEYVTLTTEWKYLADAYGIRVKSYDEFIKKLHGLDNSVLFSLVDDMEVLGIVPLEL
jgi:hypothetical protein